MERMAECGGHEQPSNVWTAISAPQRHRRAGRHPAAANNHFLSRRRSTSDFSWPPSISIMAESGLLDCQLMVVVQRPDCIFLRS
jgi:hypothetical protein